MTKLEKLTIASTIFFAVIAWIQNEKANQLSAQVAEFENDRFNYSARIENGSLVVENMGDSTLEPDSVRAIAIFVEDVELDTRDIGIALPLEAARREQGARILPDVADAVCKAPRYNRKCKTNTLSQLTIVFEINGIKRAHQVAL